MTTHTITAEIRVSFHLSGPPADEREVAYPKLDIEFSYLPGNPATPPSYSCGGEPACPAEIEFISAKLISGDGLAPTQDQIDGWAEVWLCDAGYEMAVAEVANSHPDPDEARERAFEDARDESWRGDD